MKMIKLYLLERNYPVWGDLLVVGSVFGSAFFFLLGRIGLIEPDGLIWYSWLQPGVWSCCGKGASLP